MVIKYENNTKTCILEKVGLTEFGKIIILGSSKTKNTILVKKKIEFLKIMKSIFGASRETLKNGVFGRPGRQVLRQGHIPSTGGLNRMDTLRWTAAVRERSQIT